MFYVCVLIETITMIQDEKFIEGMIESSKVLLKSIDLMKQYYDSKKKEDNPVTERNNKIWDDYDKMREDQAVAILGKFKKKEESVLEKGKEVLNSQNEKPKALFVSDDTFGIYEVMKIFIVDDKWEVHSNTVNEYDGTNERYSYFKKLDNATEYILMNKPILSLNDLLSVWTKSDPSSAHVLNDSPMYERIKKIAESKLNNK